MAAMMRCLSSCFDATRMWRRTERASLEKKALDKIEPGTVLGSEGEFEAAGGLIGEPRFGFLSTTRVAPSRHLPSAMIRARATMGCSAPGEAPRN
jgi:hypothetical protein